jgi:hypothetical protein
MEQDVKTGKDPHNAGDGGDLAIFTNLNSAVPFFASTISSDHVLSADDPFAGTSVAPFSFATPLTQGNVLVVRKGRTALLT